MTVHETSFRFVLCRLQIRKKNVILTFKRIASSTTKRLHMPYAYPHCHSRATRQSSPFRAFLEYFPPPAAFIALRFSS